QRYTFVWNGLDAYGRPLQGEQRVSARIGFVYLAVYYPTMDGVAAAFGRIARLPGLSAITARPNTSYTLWRNGSGIVGGWDATADGLGGWSLASHHSYSPQTQALYRGDGTRRGASDLSRVVSAVAGDGRVGSTGDG